MDNMHSDCAFTIGDGHEVCEDYAASEDNAFYSFVAVSDGCSSSTDTDIGARILARRAIVHATEDCTFDKDWFVSVAKHSRNICRDIFAHRILFGEPLDATLLVARATDRVWDIACYGDGFIVLRYHDKSSIVISVSFSSGYPQYVSYELDSKRKELFHRVHQGCAINIADDLEMIASPINNSTEMPFVLSGNITKDLHSISVVTDGAETFSSVQNDYYHLRELTNYKNIKGRFVQRRMNKCKKDADTQGETHYDDIAVGAICFRRHK